VPGIPEPPIRHFCRDMSWETLRQSTLENRRKHQLCCNLTALKPGSVPRSREAAVIHLGLPLPAASCGLPASIGRAALDRSRREPWLPS
jgi:hypothetical protein